jgi:hypothetical protein
MRNAQTATEYLIILAIVIIIAVIVIGALGGIPALVGAVLGIHSTCTSQHIADRDHRLRLLFLARPVDTPEQPGSASEGDAARHR